MIRFLAAALLCLVSSCGMNPAFAQDFLAGVRSIEVTLTRERGEVCSASQYGVGDGYHGRRTASGERFDTHALTAAHRTRRFGSRVTVTNLANGRSVAVRINDRFRPHGQSFCESAAGARVINGYAHSRSEATTSPGPPHW